MSAEVMREMAAKVAHDDHALAAPTRAARPTEEGGRLMPRFSHNRRVLNWLIIGLFALTVGLVVHYCRRGGA